MRIDGKCAQPFELIEHIEPNLPNFFVRVEDFQPLQPHKPQKPQKPQKPHKPQTTNHKPQTSQTSSTFNYICQK